MNNKTISKSTLPQNDFTNNISITYQQFQLILQNQITHINIYNSNKQFIKTINQQHILNNIKSHSTYFLIKYN